MRKHPNLAHISLNSSNLHVSSKFLRSISSIFLSVGVTSQRESQIPKHLALPSAGFFPSSGSQSVITAKGIPKPSANLIYGLKLVPATLHIVIPSPSKSYPNISAKLGIKASSASPSTKIIPLVNSISERVAIKYLSISSFSSSFIGK